MTTIYDAIASDHTLTRHLLERVQTARSPDWRHQLCAELLQVMQVQAQAKQIVLAGVARAMTPLQSLLAQSAEEQDIAQTYLKEALSIPSDSAAFTRLVSEARAELEHAMCFETEVLLPRLADLLDDVTATHLGQTLRLLKDEMIEADYKGNLSLRADAGYYA